MKNITISGIIMRGDGVVKHIPLKVNGHDGNHLNIVYIIG
jgi:hypothetical protein